MVTKMALPTGHCPNLRVVKRDTGDYVTEGKVTRFVITKEWEEIIQCQERSYTILDASPFSSDSGFEPRLLLVKCNGCGQNYFVFPKQKKIDEAR